MVYYRHTVIRFRLLSFQQARESILKTMHLAKVIQGLIWHGRRALLGTFARCYLFFAPATQNLLKGEKGMTKKDEIRIGSIIKEVRVKLDPDGVRGPLIKNYKVFFVSGDGVQMEGERIKCLKLDQLGVVQRDPGYPDSFHEIRRFGYCREEDLDTFIEAMLNDMLEALVGYRKKMRFMQEHLNQQLENRNSESIKVDWDRYRFAAISESLQWVTPYPEGDGMDWSSTQEVMMTKRVEIEDQKTGIVFYVNGLEGLSETGIMNRMKRAIRDYEQAQKFIIVSEEGFWNNEDGWCLSKEDATRFLDQDVQLPIGKGVKIILETEPHTFTDEAGNVITE